MLFRCPSCGAKIRLTTPEFKEKVVRYLCLSCEKIVRLDVESDQIPTSSSATSTARESGHHSRRVLIVDDALGFIRIAEGLLTREGFQVITAQDGAEALKKVTEEHPDAILLDLFMPKMSGFEVLKALRTNTGYKNFRNIPVLVTSGSYNPAESEILHDLGANGFIAKDAIPEFLTYRIRKMLEHRPRVEEI